MTTNTKTETLAVTLAGALRAALPAVSRDKARPHLGHVYIYITDDGPDGGPGVRVAATDGHRLVGVDIAVEEGKASAYPQGCSAKLTREEAESLMKRLRRPQRQWRDRVSLGIAAGQLRVTASGVESAYPMEPVPDWLDNTISRERRAEGASEGFVGLDARYLAEAASAVRHALVGSRGDGAPTLRMRCRGSLDPVLLTAKRMSPYGGDHPGPMVHVTIIIMPVRLLWRLS